MSDDSNAVRKARQAQRSAQFACLAFGVSLLVWGLTPPVLQRVVGRDPAVLRTFAANSLTVLLGLTFIGLYLLIRRGRTWALWATVLTSLGLLTGGLCVSLLTGAATVSMCGLLLATTAGLTSAFAITTRRSADGVSRWPDIDPPRTSARSAGPSLTPTQERE
ncbi:MAG: hypothetical protein AB1601_02560 [Planctomycetota bacterium]